MTSTATPGPSPQTIVAAMIGAIERKDLDEAVTYMADDIEYDNVPMGKVFGPAAVRTTLEPFLARCRRASWEIVHQVASGDTVMNERIDRFEIGDRWVAIAVAGVFVVRDGRVVLWRDYFDLASSSDAFR